MASALQKVELPDGFAVYASSGATMETKFIYKEIFQDKCYDIASFPKDAFMIDAGGNIGMFSLYMKKQYPSAKIMAFEPAPDTFKTFQQNMKLHNISDVEVHQCGLGRDNSEETLTFYPHMPGNSTLYVDDKDEQMKSVDSEHEVVKLLKTSEQVRVDIKRLSVFLNRIPDLKRIDLLKIDVEGAELDVLHGLDEEHWHLVENVALEICDNNGDLVKVETLLLSKGFQVSKSLAEWAPKELPMYMVVAKRN
ncbi:hypothetical protein QQS21_000342 [Conoideocrella luteorostrata]|uniref:Methyltransferase FkbM domain-containing protein n=1 Tax=Conoideocrella luteorostrata TaxID=1105319 RepID=A0AAJ0FZB7_9HYPO|nr:hypothetical protein QQS21_000342 [Conoideocrella luteorostrata]